MATELTGPIQVCWTAEWANQWKPENKRQDRLGKADKVSETEVEEISLHTTRLA